MTQKNAHFIGICGAGMSAVASLMQQDGWHITGSDEAFYPPVSDYVASLGITTFEGYAADNIPEDVAQIIIGKNARLVPETNPEVAHAFAAHKDRVKSFPEILGQYCAIRQNIVVTGSYGKSTVSALIAWCLMQAGKDASYFVGALPKGFAQTSHLGKGPLFVLEGDEYPSANWDDRSKFEHYCAKTVVLTSACHDHVNVFPTLADYHRPFKALMNQIEQDGTLVACIGETNSKQFYDQFQGKKRSYALDDETADFTAHNLQFAAGTCFQIVQNGQKLGTIESQMLGRHNVENVLAAATVLLGDSHLTFEQFSAAIASFEGLTRRLDRKVPPANKVHAYEGFGSSYEKARSAIDAMRLHFADHRLIVLFEPHTFTWRNKTALGQYQTAFNDTDTVYIYRPPSQGAATYDQASLDEIIAATKGGHDDVRLFDDQDLGAIARDAREDDVILVLSSGSFGGNLSAVLKSLILD